MERKKVAPVPIFAATKRPRQALLAHPNNYNSGLSADNVSPAPAAVGSGGWHLSSVAFRGETHPAQAPQQQTRPAGPRLPRNPIPTTAVSYTAAWNHCLPVQQPTPAARPAKPFAAAASQQQQQQHGQQQSLGPGSGPGPRAGPRVGPTTGIGPAGCGQTVTAGGYRQRFTHQIAATLPALSNPAPNTNRFPGIRPHAVGVFHSSSSNAAAAASLANTSSLAHSGSGSGGAVDGQVTQMFGSTRPAVPRHHSNAAVVKSARTQPGSTNMQQMPSQPFSAMAGYGGGGIQDDEGHEPEAMYQLKMKSDKLESTRVLTVSIADMKQWAAYRNQLGPVLFELFGVVNSAVSVSPLPTRDVNFVLRDSTDSIKSVFYQIDRPLPRLTRGLWYRCVGRCMTDCSGGPHCYYFHCVTVRPVTDAEKRGVSALISASQSAFQQFIATDIEL